MRWTTVATPATTAETSFAKYSITRDAVVRPATRDSKWRNRLSDIRPRRTTVLFAMPGQTRVRLKLQTVSTQAWRSAKSLIIWSSPATPTLQKSTAAFQARSSPKSNPKFCLSGYWTSFQRCRWAKSRLKTLRL